MKKETEFTSVDADKIVSVETLDALTFEKKLNQLQQVMTKLRMPDKPMESGTQTHLQKGEQLMRAAMHSHQQYQAQYAKFIILKNELEKTKLNTNRIYQNHYRIAKIVFYKNHQARLNLMIEGARRQSFVLWQEQLSTFYARLLTNKMYQDEMKSHHTFLYDLKAGHVLTSRSIELNQSVQKESKVTLKLSKERTSAYRKLTQWFLKHQLIQTENAEGTNETGVLIKQVVK